MKGLITSPAAPCKPTKPKGAHKSSLCETVEEHHSIDSPWALELYTEGSEIRHKITNGGSGAPLWQFSCKTFLGNLTETCGLPATVHMSNNTSAGDVEMEFDTKTPKTTCGEGGAEKTEWLGALKIKPAESKIEAIKVE
jgi:hypothetical protein